MQEIALSNNLAQIEVQIQTLTETANNSIWEIGRRFNHVKEKDLTHGQFTEWVEKQGFHIREAQRLMKIASDVPKTTTLSHLGVNNLYLIATLPDDQKQEQIERSLKKKWIKQQRLLSVDLEKLKTWYQKLTSACILTTQKQVRLKALSDDKHTLSQKNILNRLKKCQAIICSLLKKGQFIRLQHSRLKHHFNVTKYTHIKHTEAQQAFEFLKSLKLSAFSLFETRETPKQKEIIALENGVA